MSTATSEMNREQLIAQHVEALVGLGWRWEGRGLVPRWCGEQLPADVDQQLATELINHPNGGSHEI
jgi:hypothetical protein